MKLKFFIVLLLLFVTGCSEKENNFINVETPDNENPVSDPDNQGNVEWNLVFDENFDNSLSNWTIWDGGAFNNEIQLYRNQQLNIDDGFLIISAQREAVQGATSPFDPSIKNFEYVSGRVETMAKYGPSDMDGEREYRFVARIKLPPGNGMWPAFWSFSDPWPTNGEIDILEARGNLPMEFQSNIFYGTQTGVPLTQNENTEELHQVSVDLTTDFHEYELIWRAESLTILFDGEIVHTYAANSENFVASLFSKKHHLILNLAVGGAFFNGVDSADFVDSSEMVVDWVRVYKR